MSQEQRPPFTPYPAYKPSGVEWLGDIPEHWQVRRLKTLATIISGATPSTIIPAYWDGDVPWITPEDLGRLTSRYIGYGARNISQAGYDACGTKLAPAKSLVISTRAPIGHTAILQSDACVNQGCRLLAPNDDAHSEFLYFQLTSLRSELQALGQGSTFTELSRMNLGAFKVAVPPLAEQRAIAAYLDRKGEIACRHADVSARLIACLRELRQAEIRQAVTRGLDADAPLRASGVEWLGEVAAHWDVRRLKYWVDINKRSLPETTNPDFEFRYIEIGGVSTGKMSEEPALIRFMNAPSRARRVVRRGDTIVSTVRTYLKAVWFAEENEVENIVCSTGFATLTPRSDTFPKFVTYVAQSDEFTNQVTADSVGVAYPAISESKLGDLRVPVPPLAEQRAIAAHLDGRMAAIDAAIAHCEREAALVGEYWARLTMDAVTGQVDVREGAEGGDS